MKDTMNPTMQRLAAFGSLTGNVITVAVLVWRGGALANSVETLAKTTQAHTKEISELHIKTERAESAINTHRAQDDQRVDDLRKQVDNFAVTLKTLEEIKVGLAEVKTELRLIRATK